MADIKLSMELLKQVEHSGRTDKLLHKNKGEIGLTFFGIYEGAHPNWKGWNIVKRYLDFTPDIKQCSRILANVTDLYALVCDFYKEEFWDKARLDEVKSQKIADEIFIFGVNANMKVAVIKAQFLIDAKPDGVLGTKTLALLNKYDEDKFDVLFDEEEIKHYDKLIKLNSKFKINEAGWHNRARAV